MATKTRTYKDYKTVFEITEVDKDRFVLLGVLTKKQLDALRQDLQQPYEERANSWRGQYQALAKAIVGAFENLKN